MELYKKLIKVLDDDFNVVAIVRIKGDGYGASVSVSVTESRFISSRILLYDGKNYYNVGADDYLKGLNLDSGACVAFIENDKVSALGRCGSVICNKEDFINYEKNRKEQSSKIIDEEEAVLYDDFKIAEENYYLKESDHETENNRYDEVEKADCHKDEKRSEKAQIVFDEASACNIKKTAYKPENDENNGKTLDFLSKKDDGRYREEYQFTKIVAGKDRCNNLEQMIPNSRFYKIDENKLYYFGAVFDGEKIACLVYGVPSNRGTPPKGFENAYFVPHDYFNSQSGYYCLFQPSKKST